MWSLVDSDGMTASGRIPPRDPVLLMASIFLTYLAGVIPVLQSSSRFQKNIADDDAFHQSSTSSGSAWTNSDQHNLNQVWDAVRGKLLDSLDTFERGSDLRTEVLAD